MLEDENLFVEEYREFLSRAKTERLTVDLVRKRLETAGFRKYEEGIHLEEGSRIYFDCHGKSLAAVVVGCQSLLSGLNIVASHVDSPHLDLKPNPFMPSKGVVYLDTHHYGYIKKYQWLTIPLSLCGVVFKKNGRRVDIVLGDALDDPRFMITDCAPHFDMDQESCKIGDLVSAEDMDVIAYMGELEEFEKCLKERYCIDKGDFGSAELEIVPSGNPVYLGFDKRLLSGYGQDDKACVFASLYAMEQFVRSGCGPSKSAMLVFGDKEEVGAVGSTGIDGALIENVVLDMARSMPEYNKDSYLTVRKTLMNSRAISADACVGSDPHFAGSDSTGNESKIGGGVVLHKYEGGLTKGGVSDTRAEFVAEMRGLLDKNDIRWQISENGRQEKGSSGTQANSLAKYGMDVVDIGIPLWNMHSPWEISSVSDCYMAYKTYKAFLPWRGC